MPRRNRFFAHLLPEDIQVWEDYLSTTTDLYDSIEYDVRVGQGKVPSKLLPSNMKKMAYDLTRKRIDAVGISPDKITIIEITRLGDIKSVGQLTVYPILYKLTYPQALPLRTLLICRRLDSDILPVLRKLDIDFITV